MLYALRMKFRMAVWVLPPHWVTVEAELKNHLQKEVSSEQIGDMVLEKLKKTDHVAYIRFASVYKDFNDAQSFISIISELE